MTSCTAFRRGRQREHPCFRQFPICPITIPHSNARAGIWGRVLPSPGARQYSPRRRRCTMYLHIRRGVGPLTGPGDAARGQELGIDRPHLGDGLLEGPPRGHQPLDLAHPLGGNPLHALLPPHHVGEGPHRMPFPGGTVTCGLPTPPVRQGQGSRKRILGNPQPPEQCVLPLPEPGRLGTSRSDLHGSDCINTHRFPTVKPPPATAKIGTTSSEAAQCSRREFSRRLL